VYIWFFSVYNRVPLSACKALLCMQGALLVVSRSYRDVNRVLYSFAFV